MKQSECWRVRSSPIHGRGMFAIRTIRKGAKIIEYRGARISESAANDQPARDPKNLYHTFLFQLSDGTVIDGGARGNSARWINHSCAPNCETYEEDSRVYIAARRTIRAGEELTYDYQLSYDGRIGARVLAAHVCRCGAPRCRGTMLARPRRKSR